MSDETLANQPGYRLALALQAIRDAEAEYADVKREFKDRLERLHQEVDTLKLDILTGQKQLPLEPVAEVTEDGPDPLYADAVAAVREAGKATTTLLQQKFGITYGRATRLIDQMEAEGIVAPADGPQAREVIAAAMKDLIAPIDGKGITSMSIELAGHPETKVTITAEDAANIRKSLQ